MAVALAAMMLIGYLALRENSRPTDRGNDPERRLDSGRADYGRIFERFYRADVARADSEGTGLGLAIVRVIVQAHGGDVAADDREGGGALFRVRLPLKAPESPSRRA